MSVIILRRLPDVFSSAWWRHQMETFSALLAICVGNSPVPGEFPAQRPVTRSFDVFFDLHRINGWVNNREVGDLRRYRAHYGVTVMVLQHVSCLCVPYIWIKQSTVVLTAQQWNVEYLKPANVKRAIIFIFYIFLMTCPLQIMSIFNTVPSLSRPWRKQAQILERR